MQILHDIFATYASFFDWRMWGEVLSDPVSWGYIGVLVVLEGLLSADNALVLAIMVKHLPKEQQKKALTYGLFGAYFFRFVLIGVGMYLIKFTWIKILGAVYLAWLVYKHFKKTDNENADKKQNKHGWLTHTFGMFWGTVISVELLDLAFSVDSILAAFAISEKVWILLLGGMIGILLMRTVAKLFLVLIEKVPELENAAYILIGLISVKMLASAFGYELNHYIFFILIITVFLITIGIHMV
ncbi:TerC family protein, partial [Bacillaceae bacterium Marseille-Q3522]|nr:TerC family protein [Bacillaceae bacterium Marseille-Q3522]